MVIASTCLILLAVCVCLDSLTFTFMMFWLLFTFTDAAAVDTLVTFYSVHVTVYPQCNSCNHRRQKRRTPPNISNEQHVLYI